MFVGSFTGDGVGSILSSSWRDSDALFSNSIDFSRGVVVEHVIYSPSVVIIVLSLFLVHFTGGAKLAGPDFFTGGVNVFGFLLESFFAIACFGLLPKTGTIGVFATCVFSTTSTDVFDRLFALLSSSVNLGINKMYYCH